MLLLLLRSAKLCNQRRRARGCPLMHAQNFTCVLNEAVARFAMAQKLDDRSFEGIGIADLDRAFFRNKGFSECREVFHMRPKNDWLAHQNRFDRIFPAMCSEAFSHENNGGNNVPISQFAR